MQVNTLKGTGEREGIESKVNYQISKQYGHKNTMRPLTCIYMLFYVSVGLYINMKHRVLARPPR